LAYTTLDRLCAVFLYNLFNVRLSINPLKFPGTFGACRMMELLDSAEKKRLTARV